MNKNAKIFEIHLNPVMLVVSLDILQGVLSDEYPYVRVSVIFQDFSIILY